MVDFRLSDEQKALQKLAHEFAEQEIRPVAAEYDRNAEFPWPVLRKAFALGLMNMNIPPTYGGPGLGVLDQVIAQEELSWGCSGIAGSIFITSLAAGVLLAGGSDEQKSHWLPPLARELTLASYAVTEPAAGSDVAGIQTTATAHGGDYVLKGNKRFITAGGVCDWTIVFAYTDKAKGHDGMSAFIVPRASAGLSVPRKEDMMGQRASNTAEVVLDNVVVPAANRVGREGDAFRIAMAAFDKSRPGVAASAIGVARAAMEHAVGYAKQRRAFGVPIAQHQAIQFMLAEMRMNVDAARHLAWHAAWKVDQGERNSLEAAAAKAFAADACMKVTTDAVQVFGGYGFSREYPVEKLMRDAKVMQIYEGTSQIQRMIIARQMLR
ncbi:MAG: acyl-CoA dehydrogenase family protein [Chloroflexi bacterium]|nr:acyl-CoA dehydrogenase family protein [Chloroflexota bacterium]